MNIWKPPYKNIAVIVVLLLCSACVNRLIKANLQNRKDVLSYVDTRIGTAYSIADVTVTEVEEPSGYVSPIVGNPSALTHWTPQTARWTKRIISVQVPYWYEHKSIQGFRGTRYPNGAVVREWGALSLMPMTGKIETVASMRASKFNHDSEIAKPHYYSVQLDDYDIKAEFTAAAKTGFFQFAFPQSDSASLVFDGVYVPGYYRVIPERNEIEGYTVISENFKNYFVARFNKEFESYGLDLNQERSFGSDLVKEGFKVEYFNNKTLTGEPVLVVKDSTQNYPWEKAPFARVNADLFSARYTGSLKARHAGNHRLYLTTDHGVRLYINNELVINSWDADQRTADTCDLLLEKGEEFLVRIEYFDSGRQATAKLKIAEPLQTADLVKKIALKGDKADAVHVSFSTIEGEKVHVKVATSLIGLEQARLNMDEEYVDFNFEKAVAKAADVWENELNKIQVEGDEDDKIVFYTALTKCFVNPRNLNEMGKYFSPFDKKIHEGHMYTDLSLWDTFRSLHPLWVLLKPEASSDVINGMLNAYKEGGWIPKWPNPSYRNIMMGTHGDAVIADAYIKGIRGFDAELAFEAMLKNANTKGDRGFAGRVGVEAYNELGYVPSDNYRESVARTLEFAYDDYCIAQMAKALGKEDAFSTFMERSKRYLHVLDKETGMVRGRMASGNWLPVLDKSISVWARGTERDTKTYYQNYTLFVPHDIPGLAEFMGGNKQLEEYLDSFFDNDYYYVGDEFSMHAPFMYNSIGAPWKTQRVVRDILTTYFLNDMGGLPGNDDCGQLSSWYVFGAMGFYPACPGDPVYQICSPLFNKVQMKVGNGKVFTIVANNNSRENVYIQSATLNGKPYNYSWLHHEAIIEGGQLILEMGSEPNKFWGID